MNPRLQRTPLFLQVAKSFRKEILHLPAGTKLDTDIGLSRRFGVGVSVIREALSILAREGLITRHVGRGTFTAAASSSKPIAILCDLDLCALPYPHVMLNRIQEVRRQVEARGRKAIIYLGDQPPVAEAPQSLTSKAFFEDMEAEKFAGVIATWGLPQESWTPRLREMGTPLVGFSLLYENTVSEDFEAFVRRALEALKKRGRRRIAYLGAVAQWNLAGHDAQRTKDVARWFAEAGIEFRPEWFCQRWHHSLHGAGWTSFREMWISRKEKPDGVIIPSYATWPDTRRALVSLNIKVPTNLDVVLSRDTGNLAYWPASDTIQIALDQRKVAREAVNLLFDLMTGKPGIETRRVVDAWFVIEPSSDAPHPEEIAFPPTPTFSISH